MNRRIALCFLLPGLLALAGCDESRFVVDPLGEARVCESDLAGAWRIVEDSEAPADYLVVAANCDVRLVNAPRPSEGGVAVSAAKPDVRIAPSIGRVDRALYATLTDEDWHRAGNDPDDAAPHGGYSGFHVLWVKGSGDRRTVHAVDHVALAKAIIDGKVRGEVAKTEDSLRNRVDADAAAVRKLLRERWLFRRKDPLRIERVDPAKLPPGLRRRLEAIG
jgi:hypothetical protein